MYFVLSMGAGLVIKDRTMPTSSRGIHLLKKIFWMAMPISIAMFTFAATAPAVESKPSVAVLDFESIGTEDYLGKAVSEIMRTSLVRIQNYKIVERAQISKALSEQKFQKSGVIDDKSAVEIGKVLGADLIVVGSVVKIGNAYTINSRMIDVKTGEAKLGRNVTGTDLNLITSMSNELVADLFGAEKTQRTPERPGHEDGGGQQFLGCYRDQGDSVGTQGRDLSGLMSSSGNMTTELCISMCSAKGYSYAGTQYGSQCFCGNTYGQSGSAANCNMPCSGNQNQICGGFWANSVYKLK